MSPVVEIIKNLIILCGKIFKSKEIETRNFLTRLDLQPTTILLTAYFISLPCNYPIQCSAFYFPSATLREINVYC